MTRTTFRNACAALVLVLVLFLSSTSHGAQLKRPGPSSAPEPVPEARGCTTSREFITAYEFLQNAGEVKAASSKAREIAENVAAGCSGAARRFIRTATLLSRSGVDGRDAVEVGQEFAKKSDAEAETFATVFKIAFLPEDLDLDLDAALRLARALSTEYGGDVGIAGQDFEKIARFCAAEGKLGLPRAQCGALAGRIARKGEGRKEGVARAFEETFAFMTTDAAGPHLITGKALELTEEVLGAGRAGPDNFMQGYRYAVSDHGLKLPVQQALALARKLTFGNPAGNPELKAK